VSHIGESLTVKVNIKGNSYKREMTQQFWRTHRADVDALRTRLPYPTTFSANGAYVRFSFILQLFDTGKSKTSRAEIAGKKILLVEDDDMTALVFTSFMEEWDCVVTRVADGASAVEVATTQAHDLILMDIFLPKMSGAEAIRKIRESDNMTPIIALTSSSIDKDFTERYIGANDVLVKPVSEVDLQRMLTRYA
jgi:CheY-like chemotaxis protein